MKLSLIHRLNGKLCLVIIHHCLLAVDGEILLFSARYTTVFSYTAVSQFQCTFVSHPYGHIFLTSWPVCIIPLANSVTEVKISVSGFIVIIKNPLLCPSLALHISIISCCQVVPICEANHVDILLTGHITICNTSSVQM